MQFSELSKWAIYTLRSSLLEADLYFKNRGISPASNYNAAIKVRLFILLVVHQNLPGSKYLYLCRIQDAKTANVKKLLLKSIEFPWVSYELIDQLQTSI